MSVGNPIEPTFQLNAEQIKVLLRRLQYGEEMASKLESTEDQEVLKLLTDGLAKATAIKVASSASSLTPVTTPAHSVLFLHQID
jgi:hypothetical protein